MVKRSVSFQTALRSLLVASLTMPLTSRGDAGVRSASSREGVIATVQPLATLAGQRAYRAGGNAVDAAVAAALTLGVVDSRHSGLGGGCFVLIRYPDGQFLAIDGRETAPRAATRDMYVRDGVAQADLSQTGPLAAAVPGALAAHAVALARAGRLTLSELLLPAARIAEVGFPIDRLMARSLLENVQTVRRFPATRRILLHDNGTPYEEGEILIQRDLATTYRAISDRGIDWFYHGSFAAKTARWMSRNDGIMTVEDFRSYTPIERDPIVSTYRGYTIVGFPPPSSGGVHVAQILNILESFDLRSLHQQDPALLMHVVAEAMKLAFADRAHWLGDSDFAPVPRGLIDKEYARGLASRISRDRIVTDDSHGIPDGWRSDTFGQHTTHIAAADKEGYWVAITATINTSFGSKVIIPGTGLIMNNEMDDFSAQPGMPNAFGLLGGQNNSIEPGKRPLSSMSPTIVLKDGEPVLTLGAAGGPKIITQVVLGIIRAIDLQLPIEECVAAPRWHYQWRPKILWMEESVAIGPLDRLKNMGHNVQLLPKFGVMQAVGRTDDGRFVGVHDPRAPGRTMGF